MPETAGVRTSWAMVVALSMISIMLNGCDVCSRGPGPRMWEESLRPLVLKASAGDADAARDAYDQCTTEYNTVAGGPYTPTEYTSRCGALLLLEIEDALQTGDPKTIDDLMVDLGRARSINTRASSPRVSDVGRKLEFYRSIAIDQIVKTCAMANPPASCADPKYLDDIKSGAYASR